MTERRPDRSAIEETASSAPNQPGAPPAGEGIGSAPIRPSERSTYDTDEAGDEASVLAGPSSRPGIALGIGLLVLFLAILVWAVVTGLR